METFRYWLLMPLYESQEHQLTGLRIEIYDTKYNTAVELVKQAIELKKSGKSEQNPYDSIWVVVDLDGYRKHPQAFDLAEENDIKMAFSCISFEYWFLLQLHDRQSKPAENFLVRIQLHTHD